MALPGSNTPLGSPALMLSLATLALTLSGWLPAHAADVVGFSVIKGEFFLQEEPEALTRDPLFGFSALGGVDLADFDLLKSAQLRLPEGESLELDDLGDAWSLLASFETQTELDAAYQWGDYILGFESITEGSFSCLIELPETSLPPAPRLVNFEDLQQVDPNRPLTLRWVFEGTPAPGDFFQIYVNLGHSEVFSTPNLGEPGALHPETGSFTLPAGTLVPGYVHSLNLEITRIASTNSTCYPDASGYGAVFRSTEIEVAVYTPPTLRLLPRPAPALPDIEVVSDPEGTVVLQVSNDLQSWSNLATNTSPSGTNLFPFPSPSGSPSFFRAYQE